MEKQSQTKRERERHTHTHTHMFVAEFREWNYFDYVITIFTLLKEIAVLGFAIELWSQIANPILSFAQLGKPKLLPAGRF